MNERRTEVRHKSFLKGCVYFNNKLSSVDCLVRDISEGGARLKFFGIVTIPDTIELHMPHRDETFHAKVQWRAGNEIGVCFLPAEHSPPLAPNLPTGEVAERLARLERLVAAQERKINELQAALRIRESAGI